MFMVDPLSSQAYTNILGTDKSIGYMKFDEKTKTFSKEGAHRTMTSKNEKEIKKLRNAPVQNEKTRKQVFKDVVSSIKHSGHYDLHSETGKNLLRYVANSLGLQISFNKVKGLNTGNGNLARTVDAVMIEKASTEPLERSIVRNLVRVINAKDMELFFTNDVKDISGHDAREKMIEALKANIKGINFDAVHFSSLSNEDIYQIGNGLLTGALQSNDDVLMLANFKRNETQVNDTSVLQLREKMKTDPNSGSLVTFKKDEPKVLIKNADQVKVEAPKNEVLENQENIDGNKGAVEEPKQGVEEKNQIEKSDLNVEEKSNEVQKEDIKEQKSDEIQKEDVKIELPEQNAPVNDEIKVPEKKENVVLNHERIDVSSYAKCMDKLPVKAYVQGLGDVVEAMEDYAKTKDFSKLRTTLKANAPVLTMLLSDTDKVAGMIKEQADVLHLPKIKGKSIDAWIKETVEPLKKSVLAQIGLGGEKTEEKQDKGFSFGGFFKNLAKTVAISKPMVLAAMNGVFTDPKNAFYMSDDTLSEALNSMLTDEETGEVADMESFREILSGAKIGLKALSPLMDLNTDEVTSINKELSQRLSADRIMFDAVTLTNDLAKSLKSQNPEDLRWTLRNNAALLSLALCQPEAIKDTLNLPNGDKLNLSEEFMNLINSIREPLVEQLGLNSDDLFNEQTQGVVFKLLESAISEMPADKLEVIQDKLTEQLINLAKTQVRQENSLDEIGELGDLGLGGANDEEIEEAQKNTDKLMERFTDTEANRLLDRGIDLIYKELGVYEGFKFEDIQDLNNHLNSMTPKTILSGVKECMFELSTALQNNDFAMARDTLITHSDVITALLCNRTETIETIGQSIQDVDVSINIRVLLDQFADRLQTLVQSQTGFGLDQLLNKNTQAFLMLKFADILSVPEERIRELVEPMMSQKEEVLAMGAMFSGVASLMGAFEDLSIETYEDKIKHMDDFGAKDVMSVGQKLLDSFIQSVETGDLTSFREALGGSSDLLALLLCQPKDFLESKLMLANGGEGDKTDEISRPVIDFLNQILEPLRGNPAFSTESLVDPNMRPYLSTAMKTMIDTMTVGTLERIFAEGVNFFFGEMEINWSEFKNVMPGLAKVGNKEVRDMLADLVLDQKTWVHDTNTKPGERLRETLLSNVDALSVFLCNIEHFQNTITGVAAQEMIDRLYDEVSKLIGPELGKGFSKLDSSMVALVRVKLEQILKSEESTEKLIEIENQLTQASKDGMSKVQNKLVEEFEKLLGSGTEEKPKEELAKSFKVGHSMHKALTQREGEGGFDYNPPLGEYLENTPNWIESRYADESSIKAVKDFFENGVGFKDIGDGITKENFKEKLKELKVTDISDKFSIDERIKDFINKHFENADRLKENVGFDQWTLREYMSKTGWMDRNVKYPKGAELSFSEKLGSFLLGRHWKGGKSVQQVYEFLDTPIKNLRGDKSPDEYVRDLVRDNFDNGDGAPLTFFTEQESKDYFESGKTLEDPDADEFTTFAAHNVRSYVFSWVKSHVQFASPEIENQFLFRIAAHAGLDDSITNLFEGEAMAATEFPREFVVAIASEFGENEITIDGDPMDVAKIRSTSLEKLTKEGPLDTKSGYGKFMLTVMKTYFESVSDIDKRNMLAAAIRFGETKEISEDMDPKEKEKIEKENTGHTLGALFKGAGPIMQKMLQQLASTNVADEFKIALEDMLGNLAPIPEEFVRTQLYGIVKNSNGRIKNINVLNSLGAASVGQTLLCEITVADPEKPDDPPVVKKAVVKLLRPDAENRMMREKKIFLEAAEQVPGMKETFLGRLARLEEELDFRIEGRNVKMGDVYNKPVKYKGVTYNHVGAMKLFKSGDFEIAPTKDYMVVELAPGKTFSSYIKGIEDTIEDVEKNYLEENSKYGDVDKFGAKRKIEELVQMRQQLFESQKSLTHLAYMWVNEGLYKKGFYHGDMHGANKTIDPKTGQVTVIDFGNATKLTSSEQKHVMSMVYAASKNIPQMFLDHYRALMREENRGSLDAVREKAAKILSAIFDKDTGSKTGEVIMASLTEMQKLGLELPSSIFNFAQSEFLLNGTVEKVNKTIQDLDNTIERLCGAVGNQNLFITNFYERILEKINDNTIDQFTEKVSNLDPNVPANVEMKKSWDQVIADKEKTVDLIKNYLEYKKISSENQKEIESRIKKYDKENGYKSFNDALNYVNDYVLQQTIKNPTKELKTILGTEDDESISIKKGLAFLMTKISDAEKYINGRVGRPEDNPFDPKKPIDPSDRNVFITHGFPEAKTFKGTYQEYFDQHLKSYVQQMKDELTLVKNEQASYGDEYPVNMDKQPQIVKDLLGIEPGQTLTNVQIKEVLNNRIKEMDAEHEKIKKEFELPDDLKNANKILTNKNDPHPLKTFLDLYSDVVIDILPTMDFVRQARETSPETFTQVMQTCVENHLMSSAMAVGPGVAIQTLFSEVIIGGIKSAFTSNS